MRSLLHDIVAQIRFASYDVFLAWLAFAAFTIGGCTARGEEVQETKARAALALAKAKREREAASCFTDYEGATAEARRAHKHLVLWVGVNCTEQPGLRRELSDAVHCHLPSQYGDRTPRIVIQGADGVDWFVRPEKIGPDTARKIRAKWDGTKMPLLRSEVGIREEG
jgi:hypothetical protein